MTENKDNHVSIEALVKEANRLVRLQVSLREELLNEKELLLLPKDEDAGNEDAGNKHAFSRGAAEKHIEVLRGEAEKLANREAVLAVVGTMKAGKSTTINAIIGTEVLPTRNRPMTSLPTLIRHKPGQSTPVPKFSNKKPLDQLVKKLQAKVSSKPWQSRRQQDEHTNDLVAFVKKGGDFRPEYQGADKITEFLRDFNDLARMAGELGVDFPFAKYDEIHEMPEIEVEFAHLEETEKTAGGLALLDTPGPNEFGQQHLRRLLKDQLRKATAVLAVLDYTQLKSDADAEIRNELEDIRGIVEERVYVLVNKFDEWGTHGDDAEQVRRLVAKNLMDEVVSEDAVFPASAQSAYLANRAKHELRLHGRLPEQSWVADFGKEAFGVRWKTDIGDAERTTNVADELWSSSQFSPLLERVIGTAHTNAAQLAIESTAAKLTEYAYTLENYLSIRCDGLNQDLTDLEGQATMLGKDIEELTQYKRDVEKKKKDALIPDLTKSVKENVDKVKEKTVEALRAYFNEGRMVERKGRSAKSKPQMGQDFPVPIASSLEFGDSLDFDPKEPTVEFKSRREAQKQVDAIRRSVSKIVDVANRNLKEAIKHRVHEFQLELDTLKRDCTEAVFDKVQERLGQAGFKIKSPQIRPLRLPLKFAVDDVFDGLISEGSRSKTNMLEQAGWMGAIKRFFGKPFDQDWGYELTITKESIYRIDLRKVKCQLSHIVYKYFDKLDEKTLVAVKQAVQKSVDQFFGELEAKVEEIRQFFLQSEADNKLSAEGKRKLHRDLNTYLGKSRAATADCDSLKLDMETDHG